MIFSELERILGIDGRIILKVILKSLKDVDWIHLAYDKVW
jgi:hypothetical protein